MNWKHAFNSLGALLLVLMAVFIWQGRDGYGYAFSAGALCLFIANLDVIENLKISPTGLEGQTRKVIKEAKDTIKELRLISKDFSRLLVTMMHGEGRFGGAMRDEEMQTYENKLLQNLQEIGLSEGDLEEVRREARPYVLFDYAAYIVRGLHDRVPEDKKAQWTEFFSADHRKGIRFEPSPDELEAFLDSMGLLTDDIRGRIEDYRYYQEHTRHRRPDEWARRSEWHNPTG